MTTFIFIMCYKLLTKLQQALRKVLKQQKLAQILGKSLQPKRKFKEHGHSSSSGMQNNNMEKTGEEGTEPSVASRVDNNLEIYDPAKFPRKYSKNVLGKHLLFREKARL